MWTIRPRWACPLAVAAALLATPAASASLTAGTIVEHATAAGSAPRELVLALDGNSVEFTEPGTGTLGAVSDKGRYTRGYIARANTGPDDLAVGADGGIWFTETAANAVAREAAARLTTYRLATGSGPRGIVAGPDGALWFTEAGADRIGRITTAGSVRTFALPAARATPVRIAAGADGALWFTEQTGAAIGRITTAGAVTEYPIPGGGRPFGIAAGPDGGVWFTLPAQDEVGTITTAGAITTFPIPTPASAPHDIAAAPDGELWFTQPGGDEIGSITTSGAVSEHALPTAHTEPLGITTGIRGQIWFTEAGANRVGELAIAAVHTQYVSVGTGFVQQSPPRARPGTTVRWTFLGPTAQSVTDATGMSLYDSRPQAFVSTFSHTFAAAGDYPYRSTTTGITAAYKILLTAPATGHVGAPFTVAWASAIAAAGFGEDVRVRAPGATAFTPWQTDTAQRSAAFTAAKSGTYEFEARLVDTGTTPATSSGWSPAQAVAVS